jgi:hypothetical protein
VWRGWRSAQGLFAPKFTRTGVTCLQWFERFFEPMVRNRAGFGSGLIRFWFAFGSLGDVGLERVVPAVRFWFGFGSVSCRFWFTKVFTAE